MRLRILVALVFVTLCSSALHTTALAATKPAPCYIELPKIYLDINHVRHHIADWDTFLSLGYTQADIVPCAAPNDPEGAPITRLFKSDSSDMVFYMENGHARHIPDMLTFTALGFQTADITVLPADALAAWPVGAPLDDIHKPDDLLKKYFVGAYTIELHQGGLSNYALITAPNLTPIRVDGIDGYGIMTGMNYTRTGNLDVRFDTNPNGGDHCCWGTIVYELGATPAKILDLSDTPYYYGLTGRPQFIDFDNAGAFEADISDPLTYVPFVCSEPSVRVVLAYDPAQQRYVAASPRFASFYGLTQMRADAANPDDTCKKDELIATLIYLGQDNEAKAAFDQFYTHSDDATVWEKFEASVKAGRFYVPAN